MSRAQDLYDRLVTGGNDEIKSFIAQPVTEELFLDYKRSADNGSGTTLNNKDRANLSKAISGFGNSEGGVIVWGIDCRNDPQLGDVPTKPVPINNPVRFKSWLEQATTGLTIPPHGGVRHHAIAEGFVVTLIPSGTHAPYQSVNDQSYYIRVGSNFARAPHAVLAGLFGQRPQPVIKQHYFVEKLPVKDNEGRVRTQMSILIRNFGRGIGQDIFLNLSVRCHPGEQSEIVFLPSTDRDVWAGRFIRDQTIQMITRSDVRLPPEADLMPLSLGIVLRMPVERDFIIEGTCGCTGAEPVRFDFKVDQGDINSAINVIMRAPPTSDAEVAADKFNTLFFKNLNEAS